jgi:hypothetical protein
MRFVVGAKGAITNGGSTVGPRRGKPFRRNSEVITSYLARPRTSTRRIARTDPKPSAST